MVLLDYYDNRAWSQTQPKISVLIPTYRDDPRALIEALSACPDSTCIEIIVYDDGSGQADLAARICFLARNIDVPMRFIAAERNLGRASARNALMKQARGDWFLFLDADMHLAADDFITRYLSAIHAQNDTPAVLVGGYRLPSPRPEGDRVLHAWQAERSECASVEIRAQSPERFVFSCNVMAHRSVLDACPFDDGYNGWGWEDTDWGWQASQSFPIIQIDNPAIHVGLDRDEDLLRKYRGGAANFQRLSSRWPEAVRELALFRAASSARSLPFRGALEALAESVALTSRLPVWLRGYALKSWRALVYARTL